MVKTTKTKRASPDEGVYSVYWKVNIDDGGGRSVETVMPGIIATPNEVKLLILESLLEDLKIPIRVEEHLIRNGYEK